MRKIIIPVLTALLSVGVASMTSATGPAKNASTCTCYYGYDEECMKGFVCEGNFTKDRCIRMTPKGGLKNGKCTEEKAGRGSFKLQDCDATCIKPKKKGSRCGVEDLSLVAQSLDLWGQAVTNPGLVGGGPVDPILASQARSVAIDPECSEYLGWRMLGVMDLCRGNEYVVHPDDPFPHETIEDHSVEDISGDPCLIDSGNLCVSAILSGLSDPNESDGILDQIPAACPGGLPVDTGLEGDPLQGLKSRISTTVGFLRTPQSPPPHDHLQCYKVKDSLKLKGIVDLDSIQFGLAAGCKIGGAKLFCVPVTKTVIEAFDRRVPIDLLEIFETRDFTDADRICYKIKCPSTVIPDQEVTDQFGNRIITGFKSKLLCVPAIKGPLLTEPSGS